MRSFQRPSIHPCTAYAAAAVAFLSTGAVAQEADIAFDMVESGSLNLTSFVNGAPAFSSLGDCFGKTQRPNSLPFAVADDSVSIFTGDTQGIIGEDNLDTFFCIVDTENGDNSGPVSATWTFDAGEASGLGLYVDIGAMGDFEASDLFEISASRGEETAQVLLSLVADEDDSLVYTLDSGTTNTLNDPLTVGATVLSNDFTTCGAAIAGDGDAVSVTVTASANGGSEAVALQNLRIVENFAASTACTGVPPIEPEIRDALLSEVQGAGDETPLAGERVRVEAVVVGDFQDGGRGGNGDLNGFFLQEEEADQDGNPATSEGLFVFDGDGAVDVALGDVVVVEGTVSEFFGLTQISAESVTVSGSAALPAATVIGLPAASFTPFEAVEGMRVRFEQSLVISEYFNFDRFGEIVLALPRDGEDRLFQPTALHTPGSNGYLERLAYNAAHRILLDDGRTVQNPDPARHPNGAEFTLDNRFRGGDRVSGVEGIMSFGFGRYRVQPTAGADYSPVNPRPSLPDVGGDLTIVAFNVLNYFTTFGERGADDAEEFTRQRQKIFAALEALDADIVGLIEIENNGGAAVEDLVAGLNAHLGEDVYAGVDTGTVGSDEIVVGFIYKSGAVSTVGDFAVLDSSVDPDFIDTKNRPAIAQTFADADGNDVTVIVNHLKSKGSPCDDIGDPNLGDGSGNCNGTRERAADALASWALADPTGTGDNEVLVIGDLNSYREESPIEALEREGFVDLLAAFVGDPAYSYVFDGQFGYLDYAMASTFVAANGLVTGAAAWNINADEPDLLDYDTSFKRDAQDAIYAPDAFRSSDHDPVIVGLRFIGKEACKRGGWRSLVRPDGSPFRNQGRCVSFFAADR